MYKRTDIKVGFACNNHCTFCVQGDKRYKYKPKSIEEIKNIIKSEYDDGVRSVVFTGGEPTLHSKLMDAVSYSNEIGYKKIQIQSNGMNFSDMEYVKKLVAAGVNDFCPSIHGFKKETHDKQVGTPGSWEKVIKGLINIVSLNIPFIVNSVVTKDNYKEIPQLAQLLIKIGVPQFQFAFVHILGSAEKNKETVVPYKSDVMPYIYKALDIAKESGVYAYTEAIPYCLMQGYEWAISEEVVPETSVNDAEIRMDSYIDYKWNIGKLKREECNRCSKNNICEGPWREYPDIYGWNEFKPIK